MLHHSVMAQTCVCAAALLCAATAPQPTYAQGPAAALAGLEEIVVTARKREERLQDTPLSIVGFSRDDIERRQIVTVADVGQHAPNVQFHASGVGGKNSGQAFIRGVGQSDYFMT